MTQKTRRLETEEENLNAETNKLVYFTCVSKPKESVRSSVMRLFCRKTRCEL